MNQIEINFDNKDESSDSDSEGWDDSDSDEEIKYLEKQIAKRRKIEDLRKELARLS